MSFGLRVRLSIMMFLQYFVWGIWLPMIAQRMGPNDLNLTGPQIGWVFTVYGFGSILGPLVLGQLADRYFATERVMAVAHFLGGGLLIAAGYATSFWPLFLLMLAYCHLYMPTMALTNSITFRSMGEANQNQFPTIRVWGAIGWIAAGFFFAAYLEYDQISWLKGMLEPILNLPYVGKPSYRDCLRVSGVFSILYAFYCLTLPHTPPVPARETDPIDKKSAILESLELMRYRSFAVLVLVSALVGIMLAFYFACENFFLESVGVPPTKIGAYMTLSQIAEVLVTLLIPLSVSRFGFKTTMLIGAAAWATRFGLSALGYPQWLMIATLGLHGFAFGFFFVVAFMFVDKMAGTDIKASAQSLLIFVIYGMGTVVGSLITGYVREFFTTAAANGTKIEDWRGIWMGPFLLTLVCMGIFALFFREEQIGEVKKDEGDPDGLLTRAAAH